MSPDPLDDQQLADLEILAGLEAVEIDDFHSEDDFDQGDDQ